VIPHPRHGGESDTPLRAYPRIQKNSRHLDLATAKQNILRALREELPSLKVVLPLALLPVLLLVLRRPEHLFAPQFYAEDGPVFFAQARELGFWAAALSPTEGYLNVFPRVAAALAQLFPLEAGPLALNVIALLLKLVPVAYLMSGRAERLVRPFSLRFAAGLLYILLPNSGDTHGNITNAQWVLTPVACLILLCAPPRGAGGRIADLVLLSLFALTGPTALLFVPVAFAYLRWMLPEGRQAWGKGLAAILLAGAALQGFFLATHPPTNRYSPAHLLDIGGADLIRLLSGHAVFDILLGVNRFSDWQASFGLGLRVAGLALLAVLAAETVRRREPPLILLLYVAAVTVALSLIMPSNDLKSWVQPNFGLRYYFPATLFVVFASARLVFARGGARCLGAACLAPILGLGIPSDFFYMKQYDTRFPDQIAVFRSLPAGSSYDIPVFPMGWGMRLRRAADDTVAENPLAALSSLPRNPLLTVNDVRFGKVLWGGEEEFLKISGNAADPATGKKAGGVVIVAGGRMYPAIYGTLSAFPTDEIRGTFDTYFSRALPYSDVSSGSGGVYVLVMSADRKHFYQPFGPLPGVRP